jgi:DNA-binding XRE family transcriptional regulator
MSLPSLRVGRLLLGTDGSDDKPRREHHRCCHWTRCPARRVAQVRPYLGRRGAYDRMIQPLIAAPQPGVVRPRQECQSLASAGALPVRHHWCQKHSMCARGTGTKSGISPAQVRAARALLDWTFDRLAAESGVHKRSLIRLEAGETSPRSRTIDAVVAALQQAGIEFLDGGAPGVRIRKRDIR